MARFVGPDNPPPGGVAARSHRVRCSQRGTSRVSRTRRTDSRGEADHTPNRSAVRCVEYDDTVRMQFLHLQKEAPAASGRANLADRQLQRAKRHRGTRWGLVPRLSTCLNVLLQQHHAVGSRQWAITAEAGTDRGRRIHFRRCPGCPGRRTKPGHLQAGSRRRS